MIIERKCNLCQVRMTGGVNGFIKHGEEHHPDFYLSGVERNNPKFVEKNYFCALDNKWYSSLNWLGRAVKKCGWTNEQYYLQYGKEYLPDIWLKNTTDPVTGDMRNKDTCGQCGKAVKFETWAYNAFCGFSCSTKWYADNTDRTDRAWDTIREKQKDDPDFRLITNQVRYWTNKGLSEEDAKKAVSARQTTFNKEICIRKHGEEQGLIVWLQRQEQWLEGLKRSGMFTGVSKASRKLFDILVLDFPEILYAENEKIIRLSDRCCKVDCFDPTTQKIIEFYGDYWHGNPAIFDETHIIKGMTDSISVYDKWEFDKQRVQDLNDLGHEVLIIWEKEFKDSNERVLRKCRDFLLAEAVKPLTSEFQQRRNELFIFS